MVDLPVVRLAERPLQCLSGPDTVRRLPGIQAPVLSKSIQFAGRQRMRRVLKYGTPGLAG